MCGLQGAGTPSYWFVPAGQAPALVDPGQLAQETLESMTLTVPDVHLAPTPPDKTYVNLETWLWMSPDRFDTLTRTVSAGATSVTVTVKPTEAEWTMGDGHAIQCASEGRAWKRWMTDAARTDCSYTYRRTSRRAAGGTFTVSSALWFQADWTCSGACLSPSGTLGEISGPAATAAIRVGERQSVIVGGN